MVKINHDFRWPTKSIRISNIVSVTVRISFLLLLLSFPVFYNGAFYKCILSRSHTSLTALKNHKFHVIFPLSCTKLLYYIFYMYSMLYTILLYYLFCIVCFVESWNIHIQQHNLAFGRCGWLFFFLFFSHYIAARYVCLFTFSMCHHRFPFKSIKIKLHIYIHTRTHTVTIIQTIKLLFVLLFVRASAFVLFVYGYRYCNSFTSNGSQKNWQTYFMAWNLERCFERFSYHKTIQ